MSTASVPAQFPAGPSKSGLASIGYESGAQAERFDEESTAPINVVAPLRSRYQTGRALESLGHAVEYLVDSRLFLVDEPATRADSEALHLLMRLSREVFEERKERKELISSDRRLRLREWITSRSVAN